MKHRESSEKDYGRRERILRGTEHTVTLSVPYLTANLHYTHSWFAHT